MSFAIAIHSLFAVVWVGGMFFAHMALRPAAVSVLAPPQRLPLWVATFERFFRWVWVAIAALLASGYWVVFAVMGGMKSVGMHVHLMQGTGILMILLYGLLYFAPYQRLRRAVAAEDWETAANRLATIRIIVTINLVLGLVTVAVGSGGRYFSYA